MAYAIKRGTMEYRLCQCSCARRTVREVRVHDLRVGRSLSCGCLREGNSGRPRGNPPSAKTLRRDAQRMLEARG